MHLLSAPQRDTNHPTGEEIASPKSLRLLLKKTSSDTTVSSSAPTIGEIGRSQRGLAKVPQHFDVQGAPSPYDAALSLLNVFGKNCHVWQRMESKRYPSLLTGLFLQVQAQPKVFLLSSRKEAKCC